MAGWNFFATSHKQRSCNITRAELLQQDWWRPDAIGKKGQCSQTLPGTDIFTPLALNEVRKGHQRLYPRPTKYF